MLPQTCRHGIARRNTIENPLGHVRDPPASAQSQRQITPTAAVPTSSARSNGHANRQKQAPCPQIPIDRDHCTSEANAPAVSSIGAFRTPANTARHTHVRAASENLHMSRHSDLLIQFVK